MRIGAVRDAGHGAVRQLEQGSPNPSWLAPLPRDGRHSAQRSSDVTQVRLLDQQRSARDEVADGVGKPGVVDRQHRQRAPTRSRAPSDLQRTVNGGIDVDREAELARVEGGPLHAETHVDTFRLA